MSQRKPIPIIGQISSGKSLFLDNLLNLDLLESKSDITTKFVCIVRHNPNLLETKFYHIKFKKKSKDLKTGFIEYEEIIDENAIIGSNNIKEKIKEINKEQKYIDDKNIKYEELFYVLEIKINTIQNEALLNNYDFYDIPGLDEYIKGEDNNNGNEKKKTMKYIENLFKFFKNKIDFGVLVLNAESAYVNSSNEIIINLANILKPKKIKNYLIILNKIDRRSSPKETYNEVKSILVNDLLDEINLPDNTFISLDSRQIKNQNLLNDSFEHFLLFLFNQYITISVIPFKDGNSLTKIKNKYNTKNYSFSDYLYDFMCEEDMCETDKEEYVYELENQFDDNDYDLEQLGIENIINKIKEIEDMMIDFDIDFENEETVKLFKALYMVFKEKLKFPFSQQVSDIYDYFNNIMNKITFQNNPEINLNNQNNLYDKNFFDKFSQLNQELDLNNISLNNSVSSLYNWTFHEQFFYIGIFGGSSTGKSSIFNNILGYDILPVNQGECTKRGIVIEYGDEIALFKAKSEIKNLRLEENYLMFKKIEKIVEGFNNVKEYLEILNSKYAKNTSIKNYDYFVITLPIKFFKLINLDKNLREKIKFIDLPGFNTSKAKNNFSYENIINSISLFIFNFTNSSIGSIDNNFNKKIYSKFKSRNITYENALKNFLFNVNIYYNDELNENNINDWKKRIKNVLFQVYKGNNNKEINLTYINSKASENYEKTKTILCDDYKMLLDEILKIYKLKGKKNCFSDFVIKYLKNEMINAFDINSKNFNEIIISGNINNYIYEEINNLFKTYSYITKGEKYLEKNIKCICSCLTYTKDNVKMIRYYKNSYIEKFFSDLTQAIFSCKEFKSKNLQNIFNNSMENFKTFFKSDQESRIFNFAKNFDTFYSLFQNYKKNDFSISQEISNLKKSIDNKYEYYKTIKKVSEYYEGPTHGTSNEFDWNNGIITESENPKIYCKFYEKKCDGKFLTWSKIFVDENYDDIIVGWRIDSCWRDGTNGEWYLDSNPLLTKRFKCKFVSQLFRGERFKIFIYLMKYPN